MRKWLQAGVAASLALLLLPGCSGGKSGDSGSSGPSAGEVGNASQDDKLTKAAQDKIDAIPELKAAGIKAQAKGGQIELTGTVKAVADKDKAEAAANDAKKGFANVNAGVVDNITIAEPGDSGQPADSAGKK